MPGAFRRKDETPPLGRLPFLQRILLDVQDRCVQVVRIIDKDLPVAPSPDRWERIVGTSERVQALGQQSPRGAALQVRDDLRDVPVVTCDDQMDMIRQDRARKNDVIALPTGDGEPAPDGPRLNPRESDGRVLQRGLGLPSQFPVVRHVRERLGRRHLGRLPVSQKFPRTDEVGPRSPRVVGEPEPVGGENEVVGEDHRCASFWARPDAPRKRGG